MQRGHCGRGSILQLNKTRIVFTNCAPPPPAPVQPVPVAVVTTHFSPPPPPRRHGVVGIKNLQLIFDSGIIKLQEGVTVAISAAGPGAEAADWSEAAVVPMNVRW